MKLGSTRSLEEILRSASYTLRYNYFHLLGFTHMPRRPRVAQSIRRAAHLTLALLCTATLPPTTVWAHDSLWTTALMASPALTLPYPEDRMLARSHPKRRASTGPASPVAATAPTLASQATDTSRPDRAAQPPTWSAAGWDIYASASLTLTTDSQAAAARPGLRVAPTVLASRETATGRLGAHGAAELPLYSPHATPGAHYRLGIAWDYNPADDFAIALRADAARVGGDALAMDASLGTAAFPNGQQLACGQPRGDIATCNRMTASARLVKRAGDLTIAALAVASASRWSSSTTPRFGKDDSAIGLQTRVSHQISHRFEPYLEASTLRWRDTGVPGGGNRILAGAAFPEISLFSGRLYTGADLPERGRARLVVGGAISWSPRRTIVLGAGAETGASSGLPVAATDMLPLQGTGAWRAGRRAQIALFARWSPSSILNLTIAAGRAQSEWRAPGPLGLKLAEGQSDVSAGLSWAPSPQWFAQFDITAIRNSWGPGRRQTRVITAINLRRMI